MQQLLSSLEDERQRQFRRLVAVSAVIHVALAILFWMNPTRHSGTVLPAVVRVDLVTMDALTPAAKPAAKPAPVPAPAKPPPPPPPPPEVKKVLPKEPAPLPKPKPVEAKPKPKPESKPKPEAKPKEEPKKPEPAPEPEQDYEDVIAQLRKEAGETTPKPVETAQATGGPSGVGQVVTPEVARWIRDVKMHVTRAWILAPGFRIQPLETKVEVELGPTGEVRGMRITQSSGNPWYDESVQRAIQKASPLPAPPEAGAWPFSFKPSDLL